MGLRPLPEGVWCILRMGNGGLPAAGFAGPLSEAHRQMRPLLSAPVSDVRRTVLAVRASVGVSWLILRLRAPELCRPVGGWQRRAPDIDLWIAVTHGCTAIVFFSRASGKDGGDSG
jgi:hypothetical protein